MIEGRADGSAELEPLEDDLEPLGRPDATVLDDTCVRACVSNHAAADFPHAVVDASLRVVWANRKFVEILGTEAESAEGQSLFGVFGRGMEEGRKNALIHDLHSPARGYSWCGGATARRAGMPPLVVRLLISPISARAPEGRESPRGYQVVVDDLTEDYRNLTRATFSSLLEASLLKDNDTGTHIARINEYARVLSASIIGGADYLEVDGEFVETIGFVASMHDVGKIGTPDDILNKEGPLDDWEWDVMKEHTKNGAYILSTYPAPMAKSIALFHHEKWEGSGYPYGLSESMIPLAARITTLADVYDALRMERSYKPAYDHGRALEEMRACRGTLFDPTLADRFLELHDEMRSIFERITYQPVDARRTRRGQSDAIH